LISFGACLLRVDFVIIWLKFVLFVWCSLVVFLWFVKLSNGMFGYVLVILYGLSLVMFVIMRFGGLMLLVVMR